MKQCRRCGDAFDGKACKACVARRALEWRLANPERAREIQRRYRATHREQERADNRRRDAEKRAKWNQMKEAAA